MPTHGQAVLCERILPGVLPQLRADEAGQQLRAHGQAQPRTRALQELLLQLVRLQEAQRAQTEEDDPE